MLTATANGNWLTVTGTASVTSGGSIPPITVGDFTDCTGTRLQVLDNDVFRTEVPIVGSTSSVRNLDLRGVMGAGATVNWSVSGNATVRTTDMADTVYVFGDNNDNIRTYKGNDIIYVFGGDNTINGDKGKDTIIAGTGDDTIRGGKGKDTINGGGGDNTLLLFGAQSEYTLTVVDGNYVLEHTGGNGADFRDIFTNIQTLQFSDGTQSLAAPTNLMANVSGNWLNVTGPAIVTGVDMVDVSGGVSSALSIAGVDILDNNPNTLLRTLVPITGNQSNIVNLNPEEHDQGRGRHLLVQ